MRAAGTTASSVFDPYRRECGWAGDDRAGKRACGAPRQLQVGASELAVGLGNNGLLANPDVERQLGEQRNAVLLRHAPAAARAENVLLMAAFRAHMRAHVLD